MTSVPSFTVYDSLKTTDNQLHKGESLYIDIHMHKLTGFLYCSSKSYSLCIPSPSTKQYTLLEYWKAVPL